MYVSAIVSNASSALALERRLRCDPSHAGVMPYGPAESWLPRLSATPYPPARRLRRLDSLALCCGDVKTFSPEHGLCQTKFFRRSQRPSGKTKPDRLGLPAQGRPRAHGEDEIGENAIAHELGHKAEAVVVRAARRRPSMMRSLQGLPLSMAIGSNPLSSTRKSARPGMISSATE